MCRPSLVLFTLLIPFTISAQWLDWQEETDTRLVLSTVANSDDEEKDISAADLNNDGWTDVIVVRKEPFSNPTEPAKSDLLLMNINGVLTDMTMTYAPQFFDSVTFARDLFIGDFDGDGWQDVIVANTFFQQPKYYANKGLDSLGNWIGLVDESATRFPVLTDDDVLLCAVWGGDITGNGALDIYLCNYKQNGSGGVAKDFLLINDGTGVFTEEAATRLGNLRNNAFGTAVQIVDADNDGDNDVLKVSTLFGVPPWNSRGFIVMFNDGTGNFSNWQNLSNASPYMFESADFDHDGDLDYYVVDDGFDYIIETNSVIPDTSINFTKTTLTFNSNNGFGGNVHGADLDLDGDIDIGFADVDVDIPPCNSGRRYGMFRNDSTNFADPYGTTVYDWVDNSYDFAFLDINNDDLPDLFTGGCSGYGIHMSDNCELAASSADFDLDGIPDACDDCPTNPDPACAVSAEFPTVSMDHSIARQWNEMLLESIRKDFARPTVHARNLFHTSVAMYDCWAAYEDSSCTFLLGQTVDGFTCAFDGITTPVDIEAARDTAISFAAYRILSHRFANSPDPATLQQAYNVHMIDSLGFDPLFVSTDYSTGSAAALGNYIAECIIDFGLQDGSNEQNGYANTSYTPVNSPLIVDNPGNPTITNLNRWQPLTLDLFIDQGGNEIPGETPDFLGPEWGSVTPFSLDTNSRTIHPRDGFDYELYYDPGMPPQVALDGTNSDDYKWGYATVAIWSSHLDATDGVMIDISPASIGNRTSLPTDIADYPTFYDQLNGGTSGDGHLVNPSTGMPYDTNMVPRADYARVLAEFWADGPESETPPGHWFTILNYVSDHPDHENLFEGTGDVLSDLEWDVKSYFMMGGAMHDCAVAAWGIKGWYDYLRPISAIRAMADLGQCTDSTAASYHPAGMPLMPGKIELIETGDPLAGTMNEHVGKIKLHAWKGHSAINNVDIDEAGVGWIRAENWEPYQRPSFVTPPFAGYISGHSTFSRAAAEILTQLTGDEYFPGGMGVFTAEQDQFLVFEDGPSVTFDLQWATYRDAADESGLSRIWGGIHPPADDIPGRIIGEQIGIDAFAFAKSYFSDTDGDGFCDHFDPACKGDYNYDGEVNTNDMLLILGQYGCSMNCDKDITGDGEVNTSDLLDFLAVFGTTCP